MSECLFLLPVRHDAREAEFYVDLGESEMSYECVDDQQKLGARGGKNPKRAPVTKTPRIAMGKGGLRKPGGGKRA